MKFQGKILVIGCGSVAQCAIPLVLRLIEAPPANVTIMDFVDNKNRIKDSLAKGVHYVIDRITQDNYAQLLSKYVGAGDLIIDLAWNIECIAIVEWCRTNKVLYVNTSIEEWNPYKDSKRIDPTKYTLYARHMEIRKMLDRWGGNNGATAIVDHGANPGLVSHFTKYALIDMAKRILAEKKNDPRRELIEDALNTKNFGEMARLAGVKTIHISERDTQVTSQPKQENEFVNTWSIEGFYEEGIAPAELGWGTHERNIPKTAVFHKSGPKNQICLTTLGIRTWVRSWVPCGEITGMVIRHGEAYSISDRLTVWEKGKAVYRPTVHYAYCPSDAAITSLHELEMRRFDLQKKQRILNDEICGGRDELGVLLMGHDFKSWWCGSILDIRDARLQVPGQNATTLQVAISVVAAALWMIKNPNAGFRLPDDIDHEEILKISIPFIKPFVSYAVDWTPLDNYNPKFANFNTPKPKEKDVWQFTTFLLNCSDWQTLQDREASGTNVAKTATV
ncbi:MAG: saccharopine dehydrogenase C-terminal domain-containing protein [Candidatus Omnitrophica bacterium]|nr:saccharopine dehydrogenase C-terminal domain-containing protein [Candidatus Omnitrophota bacterium]